MRLQAVALMGASLLLIVIISTGIVASQTNFSVNSQSSQGRFLEPQRLSAESTEELRQTFDKLAYHWPPREQQNVPLVLLQSLPADFAEINSASERKNLFLRSLLPIILLENRRLLEQRNLLRLMLAQGLPAEGTEAYGWLMDTTNRLKLRGALTDANVQADMLRRVDEIPVNLALAQAAIESGWGTSRFAREGNSLFGQWTYLVDKGIEPGERDAGANHLVRAFPHLQASVRAYMHNLNTSHAYREFRIARADMRTADESLSSVALAQYLHRYSQRGLEYVRELQNMINSHSLAAMKSFILVDTPVRVTTLSSRLPDNHQQMLN